MPVALCLLLSMAWFARRQLLLPSTEAKRNKNKKAVWRIFAILPFAYLKSYPLASKAGGSQLGLAGYIGLQSGGSRELLRK